MTVSNNLTVWALRTRCALYFMAQYGIINSMRLGWLFLAAVLAGCSSSPSPDKQAKAAPAIPAHFTASNTSNPIAKYIELVGFRVTERSKGHLVVQFGVVNHSEADVGDVRMTVKVGTTAA